MKLSVVVGVMGALAAIAEAAYTGNPTAIILAATAFVGVTATARPMFSKVYDPDGHAYCADDIDDGCMIVPNMDKVSGDAVFTMVGNDKYTVICLNKQFKGLLKTDALHPVVAGSFKSIVAERPETLKEVFESVCKADKPKETLDAVSHEYEKLGASAILIRHTMAAGFSGQGMRVDAEAEWATHILHQEAQGCCAADL